MGEQRRIGSSLRFASRPAIVATGTVVGPMEAKGPLTQWFDTVVDDAMGERTPEKAERRFMQDAIDIALGNASLQPENVHLMVGGDLLNQIVTSAFTAAKYPAPFLGVRRVLHVHRRAHSGRRHGGRGLRRYSRLGHQQSLPVG